MSESSKKNRLDRELLRRALVSSRSQAEDLIKRGFVSVNKNISTKPGQLVYETTPIQIKSHEQFVSRAGEKLHSVLTDLKINFKDKIVLDVGSSTGGFTDLAIRYGAKNVIAIDVGTNQLHESLRSNEIVHLNEQTNILDVGLSGNHKLIIEKPDVVLMDLSFVSLRSILPHIYTLCSPQTVVIAMVKPQFEAGENTRHKGVIKNDRIRRDILKSFEIWVQKLFKVVNKADSKVSGSKGNIERFYKLKLLQKAL